MKELFLDFLNVSLSGSFAIGVVLVFRLVFRKTPKALICVLWLLVFARLCLPVQLETSWSLQPEIPVISDTGIVATDSVSIPTFSNPQTGMTSEPQSHVTMPQKYTPDLVGILGVVWAVIGIGMLLYTLVSYHLLCHRMKEAVLLEKGIYEVAGLDSAFLLGYFVPRIYLPLGMDETRAKLVVAHEKAHVRRMDNWLKLLGFVALSLHWFNPLVWLSYILLCRDVEGACDEAVVCGLDPSQRKYYSEALLACGKRRSKLAACPVAFGETSIGQRIKSVLSYRKPTLWICIVTVIAIVLIGMFFLTDPMQKHPAYYNELMDLLGEPSSTVFEELGIKDEDVEDLTDDGYFYSTPLTVEYRGIPFNIQLVFNRGSGLLSSFRYIAQYQGRAEEAVTAASDLGKYLLKVHGNGYQWEIRQEEQKCDFSADAVREELAERNGGNAREQWDLTKFASKSAKTYLDQIQVSSSWREVYGEKARLYKMTPHFYLEYKVLYYPEEDTTMLTLDYCTGWQPGSYSAVVTSDYDWGGRIQ